MIMVHLTMLSFLLSSLVIHIIRSVEVKIDNLLCLHMLMGSVTNHTPITSNK